MWITLFTLEQNQ